MLCLVDIFSRGLVPLLCKLACQTLASLGIVRGADVVYAFVSDSCQGIILYIYCHLHCCTLLGSQAADPAVLVRVLGAALMHVNGTMVWRVLA